MERFRLCLLGPFQALLDGRPIAGFESDKSRALLAYLATESGHPHRREVLVEHLWPERPQGAALANLRHTLADVRTMIGDHTAEQPCLLISHATLQFDATAAFVDVARFSALLAGGAAASVSACQEAIELCEGQFLHGFSLDDSPEFEAWLVLQRERFDHQAAQAVARLVCCCVDQGSYAEAARWTQRLVALEPWDEDVHRKLIWLLAQSGARGAALHQYDACVRVLADEFGMQPQEATHALAQRIRAGESDLGPFADPFPGSFASPFSSQGLNKWGPYAVPTRRADLAGAHNLPVEATPLVGRTRELAQVAQALAQAECRLLTIVGPGGIGKTRVAVEIAQSEAGRFRDGAWFVDLAPANAAAVLPTVLLKRLDVPGSGAADARQRLLAYLAGKQMLLVLDNFEHLLDEAGLVVEMLAAGPALKILVTSRARLNLREEWLNPLSGMELPPADGVAPGELRADGVGLPSALPPGAEPIPDLAAFDATRLFVQCVRRLRPEFTPTAAETRLVAAICRHLEGMPLGIELAAAWIRSLPLPALAAEVASGLQHLEMPLRNVPPRHRSITAVFDQSWRLLPAREQAILRSLSVFRGGATEVAAIQVAGASLAELGRLVDASWLRVGASGRYDMHELVRQYCDARLDDETAGEAEEVRRRHCAYFGAFLSGQSRRMNYQEDVMAGMMAEFGNLHAAWRWGVEHGQMEMARDMALSFYFIGDMLGWFHFAIQSYAPIITALETIIGAPTTQAALGNSARVVLGWLEYAQGYQLLQLGLVEQARSAARRCHSAAAGTEEGDARAELLMLSGWLLAWTILYAGDIDEARQRIAAFMREVEAAPIDFTLYGRETGRKFWLAHCYAGIARCEWMQANYSEAEELWQQAIALREEMGEQRFCAFNLYDYARACVTTGKHALALDLVRRGLAYSQAFGDQIGIAFGQMTLGIVTAERGHCTAAAAYLQQSLAAARQSGHLLIHVLSAVHLGCVSLALGRTAEAQALCEEAFGAATRNGALPYVHLVSTLNGLGLVALARGDWAAAAHYYQEALQEAPHCAAWEIQEARYGLAQVCQAQGDVPQAYALFDHVARDRATAATTRAAAQRHLHDLDVRGMLVHAEPAADPEGYSGGQEQWVI